MECRIVDVTGAAPREPDYWPPIVISRATIEQEIDRLALLPPPANGVRASVLAHPLAVAPGLGLAPGIDVTINVLKPGEATVPVRRNSNQVEMCIRGHGDIRFDDRTLSVGKWDVWNVPSMKTHHYQNTGDDLMVWLSYSNAPLLEKMEIHVVEENPASAPAVTGTTPNPDAIAKQRYARDTSPNLQITPDGAWIRGYEHLVDIQVVENKALLWPWEIVSQHVPLKPGGNQRPIMVLYNPATERRNGTTHSFFATIAAMPPGAPPRKEGRGHRHSSAAINYWFQGSGYSIVMGERVEWGEGDLMLSAPGWAEHAHYPSQSGMAVLTIQDHPLQIGMESLIWQESMDGPILALGSQEGVTGYVGPRNLGA